MRTREHYYSVFVTLVVKIILFAFLWLLFTSSIRMMRTGFRETPVALRIAFPAVVAIIACIIGLYIYSDIKEIRRYRRELEGGRTADRHP